jgi:hypothetical protein
MNRRAFITLLRGGAAWPLAEQPEQMRKIGVLHCAPADQLKPPCGRADSATTQSRVELCGTMAGLSRRAACSISPSAAIKRPITLWGLVTIMGPPKTQASPFLWYSAHQ